MAVYFARSGAVGPVKIGFTADPVRRIRDLNVGNPIALDLIRAIDGGQETEAWLHSYFHEDRIRGEWFRFSEEMLEINPAPYIATIERNRAMYRQLGALSLYSAARCWRPMPARIAPKQYQVTGAFCRPCGQRVLARQAIECEWNCARRRMLEARSA